MARSRFKFNGKGADEILHSADVRALLHDEAQKIAEGVISSGIEVSNGEPIGDFVEVQDHTTDRAMSQVFIRHAAAEAVQAKYGVLTRAIGGA